MSRRGRGRGDRHGGDGAIGGVCGKWERARRGVKRRRGGVVSSRAQPPIYGAEEGGEGLVGVGEGCGGGEGLVVASDDHASGGDYGARGSERVSVVWVAHYIKWRGSHRRQ